MNLKEAYSILEIPPTSTPDEAKKRYRELTKKYHPDINKEAGAEDKFKKINEAYSCIQSGKGTDPVPARNPWGGPGAGPFGDVIYQQVDPIDLNTTITFKESVTGCKKELKFNRKAKCGTCHGKGAQTIDNGCKTCGGKGQTINQRNNMVFISTCSDCNGKIKVEECKTCHANGHVHTDVSIHVTVPGGIQNGNILRLHNMGNYLGSSMFGDQYTDAHLTVNVMPEPGLKIDGNDVVSALQIKLIEALQGCFKSIKTIDGTQDITIKPLSRHQEQIVIPRLGVNRMGNHKVILDVMYPSNTDDLINFLVHERESS